MFHRRISGRSVLGGVALATAATFFSVAAGSAAFAAPPEGEVRGAGAVNAVKDRFIVVLKNTTANTADVNNAASNLTTTYGGATGLVFSHAVKGFSAKMTLAQAKRLATSGQVAYVEQDRTVKKSDTQANPPSWGLDRIDQTVLPLDHSYTSPTTASTVHAYVIDTGIRVTHQQFGGRASYGASFDPTAQVPDDCDGHGTHVAGTIGGSSYGVAKAVQLVAVRVLDCQGDGTDSGVIAGLDWVTANAIKPAVANVSLGGTKSDALDAAVQRSIASGVTYAVAAGNGDAKNGVPLDACTQSPAGVAEAITVGATDRTDFRASFSNYGKCVDVFAPGVGIVSSNNLGDAATESLSGTSMASPHVAGAAALLLTGDPTLTPQQVRDAIANGAVVAAVHNPGPLSPDVLLHVGAKPVTSAPFGMIARANGRYVTAENGGSSPLITNRGGMGGWEEFDQVDTGDGYIALRAHANGRYLAAEDGTSPLIASRTAPGPGAKFKIVDTGDGSFALQTDVGRYVTAENGGSSPLIANRPAVGPWEKFVKVGAPTVISLRANANGRYVTAENAGRSALIANRPAVGLWEQFDQVDAGDGFVALRARANGLYVCADSGGRSPLIANRTGVGSWEKFRVYHGSGDDIILQANANGLIVTAEGGGTSPLIANRGAVGGWEIFFRS